MPIDPNADRWRDPNADPRPKPYNLYNGPDGAYQTQICEIENCSDMASAPPDGSGQRLCFTHAERKKVELTQAAEALRVRAHELERERAAEERANAIEELVEITRRLNQ